MAQGRSDIELLIEEYIRKKTTLEGMSAIHAEFIGVDRSFSTWETVVQLYEERNLSERAFEDLLEIVKEYLEENVEKKSESYFDILEPAENIHQAAVESLELNPPEDAGTGSESEGFSYWVRDDGIIEGTYYTQRQRY